MNCLEGAYFIADFIHLYVVETVNSYMQYVS